MAAGKEVNTVWIGFMDIVPVIGAVKESVELVLAVYEGNKAVIKDKEKAYENFMKESLKKKWTRPDKPAAAAAAAAKTEYSGLRNVTEVRKENIIEYMIKGSKRGPKPSEAEKIERQKKVEAINKDVLEKLKPLGLEDFKLLLKEQLERSRRGEHVFNNGILTFHFKVLTEFIQSRHIDNLPGYNQQTMDELGRHTLPQNSATDIQTNMVVHFDADEFYVNANAVLYGEYCRALRTAILNVLGHINPGDVPEEERNRLNIVIDNMNNLEVYVDQLARQKWIANRQDRRDRVEAVRGEVANMYRTDRGYEWCIHILHEVAPLFGGTH